MSAVRLTVPGEGWRLLDIALDGESYGHPNGLRVIRSTSTQQDGKKWIQVSCSRAHRLPDWNDLKAVKREFLGDETLAVQVFPPKSRWINIHPFVLHLWCCLDGDPVPDFAQGGASI